MEKRKELFTGSTDKNANIKVHVNSLKDSSRADTATSIGVQINNSPKRGVYIDVVDGQSLLNVSVPVKERNLSLKVSGVFDDQTKRLEKLDYSFNHFDDVFPKHLANVEVNGGKKIGEIMQNHAKEFSVFVDKVEKKYSATSIKVSSGCLELKFQHTSEQSARAMVADTKKIKGMFEDFVKSCGQEGVVSVKAQYEIVEQGEQEAHAQRKDKTHSQSQTTGSDAGTSSGRIITLDLKEELYEEFVPKDLKEELYEEFVTKVELKAPAQRKERTHSKSQTTESDTEAIEMEATLQRKDRSQLSSAGPSSGRKRKPADPAQRKERTHSKSQTTGSDSDLREEKYEDFLPKALEVPVQKQDITDSQSLTPERVAQTRMLPSVSEISGVVPNILMDLSLSSPFSWITRTAAPGTKKLCMDKIRRWVSALRNSGGGKLHIKIPSPFMFDWDFIQELNLEQCLLDDELQDDAFEITVNEKEHIIVVDAKPSHELITFKFNTKIKTVASLLDPTKGKMTALLQRRRKETPAQLKGIDWKIRPGNSAFFVSANPISHLGNLSQIVAFLLEDKSLRECISAMSKNINGGSYFLGIDSRIEDGQTSCWISGFKLGLPVTSEQSMALSRKLEEVIDENFLVFDLGSGQFKRPPPDLIQCEVHKSKSGEYVFEVAVRPFNGVVFYERDGPESYKLDDKGELERLTLHEWFRKMTT